MKKPMTTYKPTDKNVPQFDFTPAGTYMEKSTVKLDGTPANTCLVVKTYANRKQANKKVEELAALGIQTFVSLKWPFLIHKVNQ